jgi:nucleoside 2-deoxyribosyltransferase
MEVPELSPRLAAIQQPPAFCEYANGKCDQSFEIARRSDVLFLYPNEPALIAIVIEEAAKLLRATAHNALGVPRQWITWKDLGVAGQIIFCELCRAMRFTGLVVADVTTLNFNLMFEIGYALGLGIPVLPIRDTTYVLDDKVFGQIGLIDTIGYLDFQNSGDLAGGVFSRLGQQAILPQAVVVNREQPLFVVKSHIQNEGMIRLMSALKKSGLRFRSFDPRESPVCRFMRLLSRCCRRLASWFIWYLPVGQVQRSTILDAHSLQGWRWQRISASSCSKRLTPERNSDKQSTTAMSFECTRTRRQFRTS